MTTFDATGPDRAAVLRERRRRVIASSHRHAETNVAFNYVATWSIDAAMLSWQATVSVPGRCWSLAGATPDWCDDSEARAIDAVSEDVRRSIDGIEA